MLAIPSWNSGQLAGAGGSVGVGCALPPPLPPGWPAAPPVPLTPPVPLIPLLVPPSPEQPVPQMNASKAVDAARQRTCLMSSYDRGMKARSADGKQLATELERHR